MRISKISLLAKLVLLRHLRMCVLQLTERLSSLAEETHSGQMKKLKEICDK